MTENFIDYVKINVKSGRGGSGSAHFRREKFVDKGGPDGGDGGRGGNIVLKGNKQMWTLLPLKYRKHIKAEDGVNGSKSRSTGAQGKDTILEVPVGTIAKNAETGEIITEILNDQQEEILLSGGMGGLGNTHFKSSTKQAPDYAQPGQPGKNIWVILELKVLADVGLVGFPNAGKSTLLSKISAAKPEIGDYAFTTLTPNLGVVNVGGYNTFVVADIPGLIEGASEGKGIGTRFLRHIERNSALLFVIDGSNLKVSEEYNTLLDELKKYNPELLDKSRIIGISKSELLDEELKKEIKNSLDTDLPVVFFSSFTKEGLQELIETAWQNLN